LLLLQRVPGPQRGAPAGRVQPLRVEAGGGPAKTTIKQDEWWKKWTNQTYSNVLHQ